MSDNRFRGSVFGGFNRRDVVAYIERAAQDAGSVREENAALRAELEALHQRLPELEAASAEREGLRSALEQANAQTVQLEAELKAQRDACEALKRQLEEAQQTVGLFEDTRSRLSQLEIDAARRAVTVEKEARSCAGEVLDGCEALLRRLREDFDAAERSTAASTAYIRGELARFGDRLSQLSGLVGESANSLNRLDKTIEEGRNRLGAENL